MSHTEFDCRMKAYENTHKNFLMKQTPVIIRIDGRAFHTFTRGLKKPFDAVLSSAMARTAEYLLNNISGCVFAYTQSDEISLLLCDYATKKTEPWFDNNQQKLTSLSASMATLAFNKFFEEEAIREEIVADGDLEYMDTLHKKMYKAIFDARAFNIPKEEIVNYFIWRQQDATRNSIQMVAQAHFSERQLHKKNTKDMQEMLMQEKGINWNDVPVKWKRGIAVYKKLATVTHTHNGETVTVERQKSFIDKDMPVLTKDRNFIKREACLYVY